MTATIPKEYTLSPEVKALFQGPHSGYLFFYLKLPKDRFNHRLVAEVIGVYQRGVDFYLVDAFGWQSGEIVTGKRGILNKKVREAERCCTYKMLFNEKDAFGMLHDYHLEKAA